MKVTVALIGSSSYGPDVWGAPCSGGVETVNMEGYPIRRQAPLRRMPFFAYYTTVSGSCKVVEGVLGADIGADLPGVLQSGCGATYYATMMGR